MPVFFTKELKDKNEKYINLDGVGIIYPYVATKTEQTALTAEKISKYCENLATQQDAVSSEINSISDLFSQALDGIREIRNGTEDIVQRMAAVGEQSKESYKNMTDLENVLEQFKTTSDDSQELKEEIDNSKIENIISPELQVQVAADFNQKNETSSSEFDNLDLDNIEEYSN